MSKNIKVSPKEVYNIVNNIEKGEVLENITNKLIALGLRPDHQEGIVPDTYSGIVLIKTRDGRMKMLDLEDEIDVNFTEKDKIKKQLAADNTTFLFYENEIHIIDKKTSELLKHFTINEIVEPITWTGYGLSVVIEPQIINTNYQEGNFQDLGVKLTVFNTFEIKGPQQTFIHAAAKYGRLDLIKHWKNFDNADLNVKDKIYEYTPLMYAARGNHPEVVEYLLSEGANSSIANNRTNALKKEIISKCYAAKDYIEKDQNETAAHIAIKFNSIECFKILWPHVSSTKHIELRNLAEEYGKKEIVNFINEDTISKAMHDIKKAMEKYTNCLTNIQQEEEEEEAEAEVNNCSIEAQKIGNDALFYMEEVCA